MERVSIRRARRDDRDTLLNLLQLLFSIEEDFEFDAGRQRQGLEMMLHHDSAIILVAEVESRVIGMCTGQLMISTAEGGYSLLVEDVVVDVNWRGRGVATGLFKKMEAWGGERKVSRFQLLADRSNEPGLKFYKKQNWQDTELICLCKHPSSVNGRKE